MFLRKIKRHTRINVPKHEGMPQQTFTGDFTWFCGGKLVNSLLDILEQVRHEFLYVSVWCNFVAGCLKLCIMSKTTTKSCDFQCLDILRFRLVLNLWYFCVKII